MPPDTRRPNRIQSRKLHRLLLRISSRNIPPQAQRPRQAIICPAPSALRRPPRLQYRKARERESAFSFPAQPVRPARPVGSAPGALRRTLVPRGRDHGVDFRHHDSPNGLALPLGAPSLHRKRLRMDTGSCVPASISACPERSGATIQRRGAHCRSGRKVPGLSHRQCHLATPPGPAIHLAGNCGGMASIGSALSITPQPASLMSRACFINDFVKGHDLPGSPASSRISRMRRIDASY